MYLVYNTDDEVIYVGVAVDMVRRLRQHAMSQPWWDQVSYIEACRFESRIDALCEEAGCLIWFEPRHNKAYPSPKSPLLGAKPKTPSAIVTWSPEGHLRDVYVFAGTPEAQAAGAAGFQSMIDRAAR